MQKDHRNSNGTAGGAPVALAHAKKSKKDPAQGSTPYRYASSSWTADKKKPQHQYRREKAQQDDDHIEQQTVPTAARSGQAGHADRRAHPTKGKPYHGDHTEKKWDRAGVTPVGESQSLQKSPGRPRNSSNNQNKLSSHGENRPSSQTEASGT